VLYDGVVIGWGSYMLVRGRQRRIELLRALRTRARPEAPFLLSFFTRRGTPRALRMIARIGNLVASLGRRDRVEVGDDLTPDFVHRFTPQEIRAEVCEAGLEPRFYGDTDYGHAVAFAPSG
jgi:hypothetical protein